MQDNDTLNNSEEHFLSGPSVETGTPFEQPPNLQSFDKKADKSGILKYQEKKLDQPDDQNTKDPVQSYVSILNNNVKDYVDGEVKDVGNSVNFSDPHYEKLKTIDQNPPYAELFPPSMLDILKELPDSTENILNFSRNELKRGSEPDNDYTSDGYDDDVSGYL